MATYKVILRGSAVNLLYTSGNKQLPIPVGVSTTAAHFNKQLRGRNVEGKWIKPTHPEHIELNAIIGKQLAELREYCNLYKLANKTYPSTENVKIYVSKRGTTAAGFDKLWLEFTRYQGAKGNDSVSLDRIKQYGLTGRYLQEYNSNILIDSIDVAFYHGFKEFLATKKNCGENRIGAIINIFKAFLHWAIANDKTTLQERTVRKFKVKWLQRDIIFNPVEELQKIIDLDLSPRIGFKRRDSEYYIKVRDIFLLQSLTGLRYSDSQRGVEWSINGNFLTLQARKSKTLVTVPLRTEVRAIMEKYSSLNEPFPTFEIQAYNRAIKKLAEMAGITQPVVLVHGRKKHKAGQAVRKCDLMSSHTARANFICMMVENNIHTRKIMKMTGITQEKTINHYADVLKSSLGEDMALVEQRSPLRITHIAKTA